MLLVICAVKLVWCSQRLSALINDQGARQLTNAEVRSIKCFKSEASPASLKGHERFPEGTPRVSPVWRYDCGRSPSTSIW